jgi:hypothetical protein
MSVQMVDGERAVGLEFPILSSKHAELHVEVLARQHGPSGVQGAHALGRHGFHYQHVTHGASGMTLAVCTYR